MSGLDFEAIRRRLDWLRACEEQCQVSPGQVSLHGYAAAAIECGRDVPALLNQIELERAAVADALGVVLEQVNEIGKLRADLIERSGQLVGARLAAQHLSEELAEFRASREMP